MVSKLIVQWVFPVSLEEGGHSDWGRVGVWIKQPKGRRQHTCLVRNMTPDLGLDMLNIGSSWKRVSFRLHTPSVCEKKKNWKKPWDLATFEAFPHLTCLCWWFHRMQSVYGFRRLVFISS